MDSVPSQNTLLKSSSVYQTEFTQLNKQEYQLRLVSQTNQPFWENFWHPTSATHPRSEFQINSKNFDIAEKLGWEISTKMPQVKVFFCWDPNTRSKHENLVVVTVAVVKVSNLRMFPFFDNQENPSNSPLCWIYGSNLMGIHHITVHQSWVNYITVYHISLSLKIYKYIIYIYTFDHLYINVRMI